MKLISILLFLFSWVFLSNECPYMVITTKKITVKGNTSLGGFNCDYELSGLRDTLFVKTLDEAPYSFEIPTEAFQCGNFFLNRDFQKTLQAKEYPKITVKVTSLEKTMQGCLDGSLEIRLVGKLKQLEKIKFTLLPNDNGQQKLSTHFTILSSDFGLSPPKKLGGMIQTDDAMNITVELLVENK